VRLHQVCFTSVIGTGWVASAGALIYLAGEKTVRFWRHCGNKNAWTVGPVDRQIGVAQSYGDGRLGVAVSDCVAVHGRAGARGSRPDPLGFIRANMRIAPVPTLPEIRLYTAHPASGLWRFAELDEDGSRPSPPYWAYHWAGGAALARHILDRPETVTGGRVLDLGAGSGIVGIAAAKAGAREVIAAEIDRYALAALGLNSELNGVEITAIGDDLTAGPPPPVNLVAVGDLFYERDLADRVTAFLDRCLAAGINVLIGDPGRAYLPRPRLRRLAEYRVSDVGEVKDVAMNPSAVFSLEPDCASLVAVW
jgi:predicted nicotinamide N-methyase